ncbi:MAG TPA: excinuclease ABC subunit UvrB [bacterium]|nr:excinuclease ABC subunit UvrB [bacterium]HPL95610.1 excinuclease ABC subunit UvrB [bacterium]
MKFKLKSSYLPSGDQPQAIKKLTAGLERGFKKQTLLGVTGSGKTFTIANVIEKSQLPTLVISHNKTLAAQLCQEFREFFPKNAVEYFVSYYDYYQPEAYLPHTDTYIEKEAQINEEIDRLRHACTQSLMTRQDVIIVASVSAIYGLGSPEEYESVVLHFKQNQILNREAITKQLVAMQFERTNADLRRGQFRLRGQTLEVMPVNEEIIYRFIIDDKIELIESLDPISRKIKNKLPDVWLFPAKHYVANPEARERAFKSINTELKERLKYFIKKNKILEYERLKRRTRYDLEMIKNIGYCNGIENYSRHFEGRKEGEPPFTLLDYFSKSNNIYLPLPEGESLAIAGEGVGEKKFLTIIDESHVTLPQIRGMYNGDKARKDTLIEHGFRLPSARDNRPLQYFEFTKKIDQIIYMSATPGAEEIKESGQIVEQIVRPTGLVDPEVIIRKIFPIATSPQPSPYKGEGDVRLSPLNKGRVGERSSKNNLSQIEDLLIRINERIKNKERVLVTTLTKRMAEDLTEYLEKKKIKVKYLHSDVETLDRIQTITDLRLGKIDVIVGVNLLREGLDIPEVSLVAILDADKEGFLRNETSLIQTIGRAARNVNGQVILYADNITNSIKQAVKETDRRRKIQLAYNKKHGITPKTIEKNIKNILAEFGITPLKHKNIKSLKQKQDKILKLDLTGDKRPLAEIIKDKEQQMKMAAKSLEFELAAILRDEIHELKRSKKN